MSLRTAARISMLLLCGGLWACESRVNIEAGGNAAANPSSVLVTVKEVWLNESATAGPDDPSWLRLPLAQPRTLELARADGAAMSELASALKVPSGTYRQLRLLLVDRSEPLTASAAAAGAAFNDQVTAFDADGVARTLPLEIPDAARGIGIETELVVPVPRDRVLAVLAASSRNPSSSLAGSGTTVPGATIPGVTIPGATLPSTTVPSTTSPGTPIPGATVPGGTVPTPTIPGATTPGMTGTTIPGATAPAPTVPGTPGPGEPVPGITVPEIPIPGTTPGTPAPGTVAPTVTGSGGTSASGTSEPVTVTSSVSFDAGRDLVEFRFGNGAGFLLNPTLAAHDVDDVGTIQALLDVSSLPPDPATGRPLVEVIAERVDEQSHRRVAIASAAVRPDGTFTLYPLPLEDGADTTTYDLVIHGPAVTTVVIRGVPVAEGAPGASAAFGPIALIASTTYAANVAAGGSVEPRGARVQFFQTLEGDDAPFLIEQRAADPVTGVLAADALLSAAPVVLSGAFGDTLSLVGAAPAEGAGRYSVAAAAPLYGAGDLARGALAPPAAAAITATFPAPATAVALPAVAGTITAAVSATPGRYDDGILLVTHDGAIVAAASLAPVLAGARPGGAVTVAGVPAGLDRGLYFLEAWAWSSANAQGSFTRQSVAGAADLRTAPAASAAVTLN